MVSTTVSNETELDPWAYSASLPAVTARIAARPFLSIHGICTYPKIGSQVNPKEKITIAFGCNE